ncbi:MAG: GTP-binding protein [Gammaproteobacteria bacterium]|nr:GTP-binding protein [Gammaproteobacteria bacterium]NIR84065.1 GTP-binding protein [Gammaproteobacteria bacterium]NIR89209.1 GTP-binding protein [Gammaproteobacteria bacterium]NIU05011.1 GTP-binding protein [Gammaproteobacteria bacterium]NIV52177.1 GTP-binding protein [Gammaproteobacteria bacterium]
MPAKTPLTLISGPLGSGKTTLLLHILEETPRRLALIINEFGELGIDSRVVRGNNIRITELDGGCVCCSLVGEFEAAVEEIIETVGPDAIVVETTGVAEPEALVADITDELPGTRIDGVITVMDADSLLRFPELGVTERIQIETADLLLLNKMDLVCEARKQPLEVRLRTLNERAPVIPTRRCRVDMNLLFGISRDRAAGETGHRHQPEYESFVFRSERPLDRIRFGRTVDALEPATYRIKGFVRFPDGSHLFNYVGGRWDLAEFPGEQTRLVFIGKGVKQKEARIVDALKACEG